MAPHSHEWGAAFLCLWAAQHHKPALTAPPAPRARPHAQHNACGAVWRIFGHAPMVQQNRGAWGGESASVDKIETPPFFRQPVIHNRKTENQRKRESLPIFGDGPKGKGVVYMEQHCVCCRKKKTPPIVWAFLFGAARVGRVFYSLYEFLKDLG